MAGEARAVAGALPNLVIIGAMKCGTTALHRLLDEHPDIAMARGKELNFFFGPAADPGENAASTWHRGLGWYASQFDASAAIRGESSPGYTSPDHPEAAGRMAAVLPGVRLVYVVRDPIERAISQYRHHRADGTEPRTAADALLDPGSQYIARGRYFDRLTPFLRKFGREQILVVSQEDLLNDPGHCLDRLYRFLGVKTHVSPARRWNVARGDDVVLPRRLRDRLGREFADDIARLREFTGHEFATWSV
ncbi:MAG TPA: sulfotransferase [Jiangellaceae bacterium]